MDPVVLARRFASRHALRRELRRAESHTCFSPHRAVGKAGKASWPWPHPKHWLLLGRPPHKATPYEVVGSAHTRHPIYEGVATGLVCSHMAFHGGDVIREPSKGGWHPEPVAGGGGERSVQLEAPRSYGDSEHAPTVPPGQHLITDGGEHHS